MEVRFNLGAMAKDLKVFNNQGYKAVKCPQARQNILIYPVKPFLYLTSDLLLDFG